jgi:hypothetical protein
VALDAGRARAYLVYLRVVALLGLARTFLHNAPVEELLAELAAASAIVAAVVVVRVMPRPARPLAAILVAALAITGLGTWRDGSRYRLAAINSVFPWGPGRWVALAQALDQPARPRRVAITAGRDRVPHNLLGYPFFGRRLQNEVVQVEARDAGTWLAALERQGITDVVSLAPRTPELGWMEARPERFERLAGGPQEGAFRLLPAPQGRR